MKKELQEQDVTRLLERIKERETPYPPEMQTKRREAFLALGVLSVATGAGKLAGGAAHAASAPMTIGMKVALGVLSTVILTLSTYLGVTLYENRDALQDYLRADTPTAAWSSPAPDPANPAFATATPGAASTATPTATPPLVTATSENGNTYNATPTKPGLHLGQTKTPKPKHHDTP